MSLFLKKGDIDKIKRDYGTNAIPLGPFCYHRFTRKNCPYWDVDNEKNFYSRGYCWFLEYGDWQGATCLSEGSKGCGVNELDDIENMINLYNEESL